MLATPSIREVPSGRPDLYAFRISGTVTRDDMAAMGARMVEAFEATGDKVSMLLIFDGYEGAETLAGLSWPALRSRTESLWHVDRYVVAGAPERANEMVEAMGKVIPVKAEAVPDEAAGWRAFDRAGPAA
jgi:hypothetical protein